MTAAPRALSADAPPVPVVLAEAKTAPGRSR